MADLAIPESPADLEGWTGPETLAYMVGPMAEGFRQARMTVGLLLHHLRQVTPDGEWGAACDTVSEHLDVSTRTLQRWLAAYEVFASKEPAKGTKNRRLGQQNKRALPKPATDVSHTELTPTGQGILDERALPSGETSKQERAEGGQQADGSPTSPGAHRGAAPAAEKVGEPKPAAPKPARGSTPQVGEDPAPPVPSPPSGSSLQEAVRTNVAMVATHGATVIAHNCTVAAVTDAIAALRGALVLMTGGRGKAATVEASNGCAHQWKQQKGSSGNTVYVCSKCDERSFDKQKTA